jgi:hypothetical protein
MRPSVALLGFLLGSSGAICFGLVGVAFIFWLLAPEHPELRTEIRPLIGHLARFTALTAVSAAGFYGLIKERPWRRWSVAVLALTLGGVVLSYSVGGR